MRKSLPYIVPLLFITGLLLASVSTPVVAQAPGWSGDEHLSFLLELDGESAVYSDETNQTPIALDTPLELSLTMRTENNLTLLSGAFTMVYMSIPLIDNL